MELKLLYTRWKWSIMWKQHCIHKLIQQNSQKLSTYCHLLLKQFLPFSVRCSCCKTLSKLVTFSSVLSTNILHSLCMLRIYSFLGAYLFILDIVIYMCDYIVSHGKLSKSSWALKFYFTVEFKHIVSVQDCSKVCGLDCFGPKYMYLSENCDWSFIYIYTQSDNWNVLNTYVNYKMWKLKDKFVLYLLHIY